MYIVYIVFAYILFFIYLLKYSMIECYGKISFHLTNNITLHNQIIVFTIISDLSIQFFYHRKKHLLFNKKNWYIKQPLQHLMALIFVIYFRNLCVILCYNNRLQKRNFLFKSILLDFSNFHSIKKKFNKKKRYKSLTSNTKLCFLPIQINQRL